MFLGKYLLSSPSHILFGCHTFIEGHSLLPILQSSSSCQPSALACSLVVFLGGISCPHLLTNPPDVTHSSKGALSSPSCSSPLPAGNLPLPVLICSLTAFFGEQPLSFTFPHNFQAPLVLLVEQRSLVCDHFSLFTYMTIYRHCFP